MRIADILFSHAVPGAVVVDLTSEASGLSSHAALAPELGLPVERGLAGARPDAPLALVLHSLSPSRDERAAPPAGQPPEAPALVDLGSFSRLAASVAHIVFFDRVEAVLENGLIDSATRSGLELVSTHRTEHRVFRYAAVFRRPESDVGSARLRLVSEYRLDKLLLGELERTLAHASRERDELRAKLGEVRGALQRLIGEQKELRAAHQQLRAEHGLLVTECQQLLRARDQSRAESAAQLELVKAYQDRLGSTFKVLERSRRSIGFRFGLATWAAVSSSRMNVFAMPRRWFRTFRGPDEVLDKLRDVSRIGDGTRPESRVEMAAIARSVLLLGLDTSRRPAPGLAGVVSPRFAEELSASARFRSLAPHNWRPLIEAEPPALVLVTADGLQPGSPWAGWGTPGGRDGCAMLRELLAWCRSIQLPVAYWDTTGTGRRLPPGLRFDAVFSVGQRSTGNLDQRAEVLLPAVEPMSWNPLAVAQSVPRNPIYVGAFDRRGDRAELAALEAILGAASSLGLEILDSNAFLQGPLGSSVRFPADLERLARRRPPAEEERAAMKAAGILICGNPFAGCDFPSWELLRGIAMGLHVVSTPVELADATLADGVEAAGDASRAREALDRLMQRPLMDAGWGRAFDRLLAGYSLRDRVDQIAVACGAGALSLPRPSVAVVARLRGEAEARGLREFLAAQTVSPAEVRVLVDAELDGSGNLGDSFDPDRVTWLRAGDPQAFAMLGDGGSTHLLCWNPGTPVIAEAVAKLGQAASFAGTNVLALAPETARDRAELYRLGPIPTGSVVAVRRQAAVEHLREARTPEETAASLASAGSGCLIASHPVVSGAASRRSVA